MSGKSRNLTPAGGRFAPGWMRPDPPSDKVIHEGPMAPPEDRSPEAAAMGGKARDPRTADNMARHDAALAPRRWRSST
jgi:hypothetical protein